LLAMSRRRSGVTEAPGGFREPTADREGGAWTEGLAPASGRFATSINVPPRQLAAMNSSDGSGSGDETGGSGSDVNAAGGSGSGAGSAPPASNPLSGLSPTMQGIIGQQRNLARDRGDIAEGIARVQQNQRERIASGERDASRTYADTQRQLTQDFERRQRAIPEFVPTQETARDIGMLGSLLMLAGATLGGKARGGALMAVQSMTGMMNGYRQGRQDLYQRERQNFDIGLRQVQAQNQQLQQAFERSQRLAQTDLEAARQQFQVDAVALGADLPRLAGRQAGNQGEMQVMQTAATLVGQIEQREAAVRQAAEVRRQANELALEKERRARQATIDSQRRNVQGREAYLEQQGIPREASRRIGEREIVETTALIEAAELTFQLAEAVRNNPQAAGVAAQIINRFERFDPSRYGNDVSGGFFNSLLNSMVDRDELRGTPDQIAAARTIAKVAIDVINARALAASGGGRMLVAEFNAQKTAIGLEAQSPQTAVQAYTNLARGDIAAIRRFGLQEYVPGLQERVQQHAREYAAANFPGPRGANGTTTPPIGNTQQRQREAAQNRANEPVRITDDDAGVAAYEALPSGTLYTLPNNVTQRKP